MKTVSVIGAGALSHAFCSHFAEVLEGRCRLLGIYSRTPEKTELLAKTCGAKPCRSLAELLEDKPDFVIELAGVAALKSMACEVLRKTSLVAVSAGALADNEFRAAAEHTAQASGTRLVIPNGAIGALDLLRTYALMKGAELTFETRKAPKSLAGAPGLAGRTLSETEEEIAFEGTIEDAIRDFPKNVNVAVAAAAASLPARASMRLISVPGLKESTHSIRIKNNLIHAELSFSALPDPANPKTSVSTAWSVLAYLDSITSSVSFF